MSDINEIVLSVASVADVEKLKRRLDDQARKLKPSPKEGESVDIKQVFRALLGTPSEPEATGAPQRSSSIPTPG